MTKPYENAQDGVAMTGHAPEPQVTPWNRDSDDFNVTGERSVNRETYNPNPYAQEHEPHDRAQREGASRSDPAQDAYTRQDLEPSHGYDQESLHPKDGKDVSGSHPERDYAHDRDRDQTHYQNFGEPDLNRGVDVDDRQLSQGQPGESQYADNQRFDDRYDVRGQFDKDYNRDRSDDQDGEAREKEDAYHDDPWRSAYPRQ